jgi:hypothetical protein
MLFKVTIIMPLAVKKKQDRAIARCGNSAVLYLPKGYFIPGENVKLDLEIDFDGNLKLTLKKCLFDFTCEQLKNKLEKTFEITSDEIQDGTRTVHAQKEDLNVDCTCSTQELEQTYVNVSRVFRSVNSFEAYTALTVLVNKLSRDFPGVYVEPDGDIDAVKIFKDPQKYHLESEFQAVDLLRKKGKRLNYAVVLRVNSKKCRLKDVLQVLEQLSQNDELLLGPA